MCGRFEFMELISSLIASIHLVVTRKDRHMERISMRILLVLPLYNKPV
jgi:hypothetical protein